MTVIQIKIIQVIFLLPLSNQLISPADPNTMIYIQPFLLIPLQFSSQTFIILVISLSISDLNIIKYYCFSPLKSSPNLSISHSAQSTSPVIPFPVSNLPRLPGANSGASCSAPLLQYDPKAFHPLLRKQPVWQQTY